MFSHKYRYLFTFLLASYSFANTLFLDLYHFFNIRASDWVILLTFNCIALLVWENDRLIESLLRKYLPGSFSDINRLILFFILSLPFTFIASVLPLLVLGKPGFGLALTDYKFGTFKLAVAFGFRINLFLHCLNCIIYFFSKFKEKQIEAEELKRAQTQAQLQQLKNQINPHFLFNNLNVLSSLVLEQSRDANQFIEDFAVVYRYILKNQEKDIVNLETELEFISSYIFLLQKRFAAGLKISYQVPADVKGLFIVPMALQMLIENSIKHNIASEKKPLAISIYLSNDHLYVANNIQPKINEEESTKIGLNNINERLLLLNGNKLAIDITTDNYVVGIPLFKIDPYESINTGR